ncbi:hypothetical protein [Cellulosilyticum ruminicola]|uniref:hypothetical protein n=1 Tax=Cellulosilyticum ruminicola TaxID=425254 RepID=UPI001FA6D2A1|nr:hypothetical protein [Cellulosilyticum ruminicola]
MQFTGGKHKLNRYKTESMEEAQIKESMKSERIVAFFNALDDLLGIPKAYCEDYTK